MSDEPSASAVHSRARGVRCVFAGISFEPTAGCCDRSPAQHQPIEVQTAERGSIRIWMRLPLRASCSNQTLDCSLDGARIACNVHYDPVARPIGDGELAA